MVNSLLPISLQQMQQTDAPLFDRLCSYDEQLATKDTPTMLYYIPHDGLYSITACAQDIYIIADAATRVTVQLITPENSQCTVVAAPHARIHIIMAQAETGRYDLNVQAHAQVIWHAVYNATATVYVALTLRGEYADAAVYLLACLSGTDTVHIQTLQNHPAAHTKSAILVYSILAQQACIRHEGMLEVMPSSRQVVAIERSQHLLCTTRARAYVVPAMQVRNHDVQCQHAAVVARLDEQLCRYLQARGISNQDAQRLLVRAAIAPWYTDLVEVPTQVDAYIEQFITAMQGV